MSFSICGQIGANTGAISCDVKRGRPLGIVLGGALFAPSDYATPATFQSTFKGKLKLATGSAQKLYPFPEIQGITDKTDANKESTLGYGLKFVLLQGKPGYELDLIPGIAQEKALRKFNNKTVPVFTFDDSGNIWGVTDSSGNFTGANALISVVGKGFDDAQNVKTTKVTVSFISVSDFYDNAAFAQTNFGIGDLTGLVDFTLSETAAHTTNVFHMAVKAPTSQLGGVVDLKDYFSTALASAALWVATVDATGVSHTITSVAATATGWDVTLDSTQFGALASGAKIRIALAAPSVLDAAGVVGVETPAYVLVTK